jgi:hypothetical protein
VNRPGESGDRTLVAELTDIEPGMSWKNLAGRGPRTLEAALTAGQNALEGVPAASALFLPPMACEELYAVTAGRRP